MREHKYRAYDEDEDVMYYSFGKSSSGEELTIWKFFEMCSKYGFPIEQYTGKEDIKKSLIFPGDIFKDYTNDGYPEYLVIVWNEKLCGFGVNVYECKIQEELFVEFLTMEDYRFELMNKIGNIHEHPEQTA